MGTKTLDVPGGQTLVVPDPEMPERATRRRYTAEYKAKVLAEYEQLDKRGKGELLRREGLYTSLISAWRDQRDRGARSALEAQPGRQAKDPRDRELERLQAENAKIARKLETAERVIEVQGKLSALLEDLAAEGAQTDQDASSQRGRSS